jgi:DNA-binding SARP family transcriptional activator
MTIDAAPELHLLSGFAVIVGDRTIPLISSAQRLLAFLAMQARSVSRGYVAGVLWPDTSMIKANANLRSTLWRAQRSCGELIDASSQQLTLAAGVIVDVHRAQAYARRLLDHRTRCDDIPGASVVADLTADLLPDWHDDDWVLVEREQYHQLRLHALEALCERLTAIGRFGQAVDAGLAAVRAEPLRESAHEALMKAHLAAGNRWEAVRQYDRCRCLLRDELGLEPSPQVQRLLPVEMSRSAAGHR